MKLLVFVSILVAAASAALQSYNLPTQSEATQSIPTQSESTPLNGGCKEGEVLNVFGSCVVPTVSRQVFLFTIPEQPESYGPSPEIPPPRVEHNILFIRTPEGGQGPEPIIVPPPRQQHVVYVLNKQSDQSQRVIEVPAPPSENPEVYFVNYGEGDNPTLPGGIDFQTALNSAIQGDGQVIAGAGGLSDNNGGTFNGNRNGQGFVSNGESAEDYSSAGGNTGFIDNSERNHAVEVSFGGNNGFQGVVVDTDNSGNSDLVNNNNFVNNGAPDGNKYSGFSDFNVDFQVEGGLESQSHDDNHNNGNGGRDVNTGGTGAIKLIAGDSITNTGSNGVTNNNGANGFEITVGAANGHVQNVGRNGFALNFIGESNLGVGGVAGLGVTSESVSTGGSVGYGDNTASNGLVVYNGVNENNGYNGVSGLGSSGINGLNGNNGVNGLNSNGVTGLGNNGVNGLSGNNGINGLGNNGVNGLSGNNGINGHNDYNGNGGLIGLNRNGANISPNGGSVNINGGHTRPIGFSSNTQTNTFAGNTNLNGSNNGATGTGATGADATGARGTVTNTIVKANFGVSLAASGTQGDDTLTPSSNNIRTPSGFYSTP
ncbi:uncharacterized PE-PGRS family protein PE_PGRS54-like [Homarus americanus]|uniref:uncharacterized PE-PGRS family protein PE_PGRS54-like n=1 Tax=Homarus americanus TaxID=6706 RepID=UPI001C4477C0|nr:uncharacterized PE-PGRS family protein PE_PGRS54-like [Homarus americanus]